MSSITLERVTKRYGRGKPALAGVDLSIASGELVALVGPSGSGKSTLLELISGLETPSEGTIRVDGADVTTKEPKERGVALVFQSYALYPHLDVARNIGFPLAVERRPKPEIAERVREVAERLSIGHLLERRPAELSGGERQRVALARAIVRRPRICLFDEPLSNLDPALRSKMRAEIKELHRELGATFVWVTHDQAEAMTLADRVVVLKGGEIRQVGAPREVYARPVDTFVASFFGSPAINLLPAETLGASGAVTIGLRPEDVEAGVGSAPEGARRGTLRLLEPLGAETWLTVAVPHEGSGHAGSGAEPLEIVGRAPRDLIARPGDPAWIRLSLDRALHFDREGRRVST